MKKYRVTTTELGDFKPEEILDNIEYDGISRFNDQEIKHLLKMGWIEEVSTRIELGYAIDSNDEIELNIIFKLKCPDSDIKFTPSEIEKMEEALNNERWNEEEIRACFPLGGIYVSEPDPSDILIRKLKENGIKNK